MSISKKATLLQFSISYLSELRFSILATIKCKKKGNLQCIDKEMRVCLSSLRPNIEKVVRSNQAQVLHQYRNE